MGVIYSTDHSVLNDLIVKWESCTRGNILIWSYTIHSLAQMTVKAPGKTPKGSPPANTSLAKLMSQESLRNWQQNLQQSLETLM